jgi:transcriptional regulator with XRE-family HTH domain
MLGERLRVLRKNRRHTLADVGRATELSVSYLSDIERGRARPSVGTLEKLAGFYNVHLSTLLDDAMEDLNAETQGSPPGFDEFLASQFSTGAGVEENDLIDWLLQAERRSENPPRTAEEWRELYYSLKRILGK